MAKGVFEKMFTSGRAADDIVEREGLAQIDDDVADPRADRRGARRPMPTPSRSIARGKASTFGFLVGQVMKATAGKANPKRVNELLKQGARRLIPAVSSLNSLSQ